MIMSAWRVSEADERKPFLEHLEDLRRLLLHMAAALACGFAVAVAFAPRILDLLKRPLVGIAHDPDRFLRSLEVAGAFTATVRLGFWSGLILASPVLVLIAGAYLMPALTPAERRAVKGVGAFSVLLFIAGVAMGYFFTLPFALKAMFAVHQWLGIEAEWTLSSYVAFASQLLIAFGLAFELPVALLILGRLGLVSSNTLRTYRRHAIVAILTIAMILTPPDIFSQLLMGIPLILLYEGCIWLIWSWEKAGGKNR